MHATMSLFFINAAECREVTIPCLVANTFAIKTDFVGTNITKVSWLIAFSTSRDLGIIFDINLIFAKPQVVWNGFDDMDTVVPQTVLNIQGKGMFSPSVVQDLAERS